MHLPTPEAHYLWEILEDEFPAQKTCPTNNFEEGMEFNFFKV